MVKLFCAIVGEACSAFPVNVDAKQTTVGDLKDTIKTKINYFGPAHELQLFLAKNDKGRGAWVTEAEAKKGFSDTTDLELLESALSIIGDVGLSEDDVQLQITKEEVKGLKGPIHVLVMVPGGPTIEKLKKQKKDDGSSAQDSIYEWLVADLFSLLCPLDKIHSTKKDV